MSSLTADSHPFLESVYGSWEINHCFSGMETMGNNPFYFCSVFDTEDSFHSRFSVIQHSHSDGTFLL